MYLSKAPQKELFPLIDVDGIAKPTIQIIAEQAVADSGQGKKSEASQSHAGILPDD